MDDIYPYPVADDSHPLAWVFFNAAGFRFDLESCEKLAAHVFDSLKCGAPGSDGAPLIKYDGLGGMGGPWEAGAWIPADQGRASVRVTAPSVDIGAMTVEEREELRAALEAVDVMERANSLDKGGE